MLRDIESRTGRPVNLERTLAVGDSFAADVAPFMKLGTLGVWLKRHGEPSVDPPSIRLLTELEL